MFSLEKGGLMNNTIVGIIVAILVLLVVFQTIQLIGINNKLSMTGQTVKQTVKQTETQTSSSGEVSSVQLPQQRGGC
jgi:predicted Holliday junction resolvase-like endonuclease